MVEDEYNERARSELQWIDVSVSLSNRTVTWPGDSPIVFERSQSIERGDDANLGKISMTAHAGTHMDAPLHFVNAGRSLDQMPLSAVIGEARVIDCTGRDVIKPKDIAPHDIRRGERILFKTDNSNHDWVEQPFREDFVYLSTDAGQLLSDVGVGTIGVDYLSVAGYEANETELHRLLLGAGIWIIEGLNLRGVDAGRYDLICLPLKIADSDGAPARAVLRRRS